MAGAPARSVMAGAVRAGFVQAATLLVAGVAVGAIGGVWGLAADGTLEEATEGASHAFIALAVVFPVLLVAMNFSPPNLDVFATPARAAVVGVIAGGVGGLLGALGYFVPATNLPVIFAGHDAGDFSDALRADVGLTRFLIVVVVTFVAGIAVGALTHVRVKSFREQQRDGE